MPPSDNGIIGGEKEVGSLFFAILGRLSLSPPFHHTGGDTTEVEDE